MSFIQKRCEVFQRFLSHPTILGLNLSSYKVAPAKSVLATICCRLLLIGMLLEYYCEAGWELFKCHCIVIHPTQWRESDTASWHLNWAGVDPCNNMAGK